MFNVKTEKSIFFLTAFISIISFIYFFRSQQILSDYDAIARLNIARKMIDSATPGVGQLGGIWLPFPQIFMLPFVTNDFLWHSGLAGSIVSMSAFILSGIFLYKTAFLITGKRFPSVLAWLVFTTNINLLLLQSMAMSESFFLFSMIMSIYFLTKWTIYRDLLNLITTGFFVILVTLTRYEGYFIFIGTFIVILINCLITYRRDRDFKKLEGTMLFFLTIASYGIVLWCLYCTLFYKDPFYWLHLYTGPKGQIITSLKTTSKSFSAESKNILDSFKTYTETMLWMNGIVITLISAAGFILLCAEILTGVMKRSKSSITSDKFLKYLPVIVLCIVLYFFLVFGYQKGLIPDIEYPQISSISLVQKSFNLVSHSNIRYGTVMAPIISLFAGFLAARKKFWAVIVYLLFIFQLYTNNFTSLFLYFQLPKVWFYSVPDSVSWFTKRYDGGNILISANRHENFMFQTGLPYKDFIYEGSRNYWITSLNDPEKYASWVIYDETLDADSVNAFLTKNARAQLRNDYYLLYHQNGFNIYHYKK